MNRGLGSQTFGGSVAEAGRRDLPQRLAAVRGLLHVEVYVLHDGPVAVGRVDDRVATVTGERLLDPGRSVRRVRLSVVLQAPPVGRRPRPARRRPSSSAACAARR